MTTDQLRDIFGRFQNLNLLFLRDRLMDWRVGRRWFIGPDGMCPIQHGMRCFESVPEDVGLRDTKALLDFAYWWDDLTADGLHCGTPLLAVVNALLAERLADADAVQAVIEPQMVEGCQ